MVNMLIMMQIVDAVALVVVGAGSLLTTEYKPLIKFFILSCTILRHLLHQLNSSSCCCKFHYHCEI